MANKEFEWRMQGMMYACKLAEEKGIDALKADMKRRGLTKAPITIKQSEIDYFVDYCSKNLYANMFSVFAYALHELFGFGGDRLRRVKDFTNKMVDDVMDLDYMGEHYVRLEDFAIEMNERYDLGIDIEAIASCQSIADEKPNNNYHIGDVDRIIKELKENGYDEAGAWLETKIH